MIIPVPSLSAAGWVTSPAEKADLLFSHFYESDKFQTYLYPDGVSNLQYLVEKNSHDIVALVQSIRTTLEVYLGRYYEAVLVDVSVDEDSAEFREGNVKLRVFCRITENGKEYSFARLIETIDSKLKQVVKLNNLETTTG